MSGYYRMHRGWLDHPALGGSREPFCRRAAWAWLIENAVFKETRVPVGKGVDLEPGQLCYSLRYLAGAWKWSLAAVQRFIDRLKTDAMIDTRTEYGRLVITICNYKTYQYQLSSEDTATDTPADTRPIRDRYSSDTNKKEGNKENTPVVPNGDDRFAEFWSVYPSRGQAANPPKPARDKFLRLVRDGVDPDEIIRGADAYASHCRQSGKNKSELVMQATRFLNQEVWKQYANVSTLMTDRERALAAAAELTRQGIGIC